MFEEINNTNIEVIKDLSKRLIGKEIDFYSPEQIEIYTKLAFYLFIYEDENLNLMLNKFDKLNFKDYNTWTWIEPLILLKNRVFKGLDLSYKKDVLGVLDIGNDLQKKVKKKTFSRLLRGETLYQEQIDESRESNDLIGEKSYLLSSIMKLVVISEMGGSEEFSVRLSENFLALYKAQLIKINS